MKMKILKVFIILLLMFILLSIYNAVLFYFNLYNIAQNELLITFIIILDLILGIWLMKLWGVFGKQR